VPLLGAAAALCRRADILLIIGTSMVVYPAAGLHTECPARIPKFYIDPQPARVRGASNLSVIAQPATLGLPPLVRELIAGSGMTDSK